MAKPDWDEIKQNAKDSRDPNVTGKSQWGKQPGKQSEKNPNNSVQYNHRSLLGGEQSYTGNKAKRASRQMKGKA